ncbi:MAG: hypothetical protein V6Z86_04310 [Hyphomicrobiales bacterium]
MYTIGQIARAIWPEGDIPSRYLQAMLTRPAYGLPWVLESYPARRADQDELGVLMAELNPEDIDDPPDGVPLEAQRPFWRGYYSDIDTLAATRGYGARELTAIGQALYGPRWQTDLARNLGFDSSRIRQWLAGARPIPKTIWAELAGHLAMRKMTIDRVLADMGADNTRDDMHIVTSRAPQ